MNHFILLADRPCDLPAERPSVTISLELTSRQRPLPFSRLQLADFQGFHQLEIAAQDGGVQREMTGNARPTRRNVFEPPRSSNRSPALG